MEFSLNSFVSPSSAPKNPRRREIYVHLLCLFARKRASPSSSAPKNPSWRDIHVDLLCLFARKLSLSDRIRLSLVCKSWRSEKDSYILSEHEMPRLILPREPNCPYLRWLDLSRGEIENFKLPKPFRKYDYIGSSNGWLIFQGILKTEDSDDLFVLYLFNPISRTTLGLPSLRNIQKPVSNVTVSSNQVSPTLMVAAIIDGRSRIVVCKPRDDKWSYLYLIPLTVQNVRYPRVFADILFQGDTLFVLSKINHRKSTPAQGHYPTQVETWSFKESFVKLGTSTLKVAFISVWDAFFNYNENRFYYASIYLALSTEDKLIMVIRWYSLRRDQENPRVVYSSTENIFIHKLSFSVHGNFLNSVYEIGDHILFLGRVDSQILSSEIFNGRRNCVIFTEDCYGVNGQSGVFNLETRKIEGSVYTCVEHFPFYLDWFLPTLS